MDYWGVGCVFFEIVALFPLFPGNNELDQIHKIHEKLGTPDQTLLAKFQKVASHMEFDFKEQVGTGIEKLIPANVSTDVQEIIVKLLAYDQANRMSAGQALKHPYFRDLREADKSLHEQ
jgi:renal tumor antigen